MVTFAALAVLQQAGAVGHLLFACLALHCALLAAEPQSLQTSFGGAFLSLPVASFTTWTCLNMHCNEVPVVKVPGNLAPGVLITGFLLACS